MGYGRVVRIAVVIPARDEAPRIAQTIEAARSALWDVGGAPGGDPLEIVVVDGGSLDRTPDRARAAGARVMHSEAGRARQLDMGWRATDAEIVLFLHADTKLPAGAGPAVRRAFENPAVAGGAFRFRFEEPGIALRFVEWGARLRHACLGLPYGDQAIFARRDALERIGGIPDAPILEDLDLVAGLKTQGRLARLSLPAMTSARRYRRGGVLRTWSRNVVALAAWRLGVDRARVAAWYRQ